MHLRFISLLVKFLADARRPLVDTQQDVFHPMFDGFSSSSWFSFLLGSYFSQQACHH
jgi:hypothetical protein